MLISSHSFRTGCFSLRGVAAVAFFFGVGVTSSGGASSWNRRAWFLALSRSLMPVGLAPEGVEGWVAVSVAGSGAAAGIAEAAAWVEDMGLGGAAMEDER
nr:unnamed protein product [Digitaria exilis]